MIKNPEVYYCPYACKTDPRLQGWYIVHKVSPHGKLPRPNDDDYNLNPPTHDGEFYQQDEGLPGMLEIDLTGEIEMEVDEEWVVDEQAADEVHDPRDLKMLDGLQLGNDSNEDEAVDDLEALDSDEIPIVQIILIMKNIRNTCNTMLFCNYIFFFCIPC